MTQEKLFYLLQKYHIETDQWVVLPDNIEQILLYDDGSIHNNPLTINFYFSKYGFVFIRRLTGYCIPTQENVPLDKDNYVRLNINGRYYDIGLSTTGRTSSNDDIGIFHQVISYSTIIGFTSNMQHQNNRFDKNETKIAIQQLKTYCKVFTDGGNVVYGGRLITIDQVFSDVLKGHDAYGVIVPRGDIHYNKAEDKYLVLLKFKSTVSLGVTPYVKIGDEIQTEFKADDNSLYAVMNVADGDQDVYVSFNGIDYFKYSFKVSDKKYVLRY